MTTSNIIDPQAVLEAAEDSMFGMENLGFCILWHGDEQLLGHFLGHGDEKTRKGYGAPELVIMGFGG
ncbi:MAG TPA: hypothetical protein EYQ21_02535 [Flavobacteriales bacterium]|nr:hypothetical protein [Flavobacteriales bacterium]